MLTWLIFAGLVDVTVVNNQLASCMAMADGKSPQVVTESIINCNLASYIYGGMNYLFNLLMCAY